MEINKIKYIFKSIAIFLFVFISLSPLVIADDENNNLDNQDRVMQEELDRLKEVYEKKKLEEETAEENKVNAGQGMIFYSDT
ncbi:hypothetical protein OAP06_01420 [Gammaproteobacteria bacterium]|nr:hypothetical protein [Gammaproteobacteria bacterium]